MSQPLRVPHKSVCFDEKHNEVREYSRVSAESKSDVWLSRAQIKENKLAVQEELMMERTREIVKSKLVEEASLSANIDEAVLLKQVQVLQQRLNEIMSLPKSKILAFLQNKYNWITDCNDFWKDLPPHVQQAATTMGYTQDLWDEFNQQLEVFDHSWQKLSEEQQKAAHTLGYNEMTWNGSLETDSLVTSVPGDDKKPVMVELDESEYEIAPVYDWGGSDAADSSSNEEDNDNDLDSSSDNSASDQEKVPMETEKDQVELESDYNRQKNEEVAMLVEGDATSSPDPTLSVVKIHTETRNPDQSGATVSDGDKDDEEEFISNFLSGFTGTSTPNRLSRSSLQFSYVPSDDEMDLEAEDEDENSMDASNNRKEDVKEKTSYVEDKGPKPSYQDNEEINDTMQEGSPLLGGSSTRQEGGLFRRILGSGAPRNDESSKDLAVPHGDDDGDHPKPENNRSSLFRPVFVFVPLCLLVLYYGYRSFTGKR